MHSNRLLAPVAALCSFLFIASAGAQGTAFTYQGRLNLAGSPANGSYDLAFSVFNASAGGLSVGGPVTNLNVGVTNGLFTTVLSNLPATVFNGSSLWLDISVRTNGGSGFTELTPRQQLTPAPYSIFAGTAGGLSGSISNSQLANSSITVQAGPGLSGGGTVNLGGSTTLSNTGILSVTGNTDITAATVGGAVVLGDTATSANTANAIVKRDATGSFNAQNITASSFNGAFSGNGSGLNSVNAATLNGVASSNFWQTGGNTGANPTNGSFLGTADNQPLELRVNGQRALRLEPTASGPNVIGGYSGNYASPGITSATVAGGGQNGGTNFVTSAGGTVSGGFNNSVSNYNGVVAGGANNSASGNASVVGGGSENIAAGDHATISGGQGNVVQSGGNHGTITGGFNNTNNGQYAMVAGGLGNTATGNLSFAAGWQAQATNQGSFVWADAQGTPFGSTTTNQFNVRAAGGLRFVTGGAGMTVDGQTVLAGVVQASQINDGGASAYQGFQNAVQSVGGDNSLTFSNLFPMTATNGVQPSLSLTIGGSIFGTVTGFSGSEGISKPYRYVVEVSLGGSFNPSSELGQQGVLTYTRNGRTTTFAGIVTACTLSGASGTGFLYTVRLESPLAYLALGTDYKIYQNLSAVSVATSIYQLASGSTPATNLTNTYTPHASLTQYGETGLNFFSRILEFEGLFYFFNQGSSPPSLVMGDTPSAYLAAPNSPFNYYGNTATNIPAAAEYIRTFQNAVHQSTAVSVVNAYNFTTPSASLLNVNTGAGVNTNYEFGNAVATTTYESLLAGRREDVQTVQRALVSGSGSAPDLRAGYTFTLNDQSGAGVSGSYVVTSVHHAGFVLVTNGVSTLFYGNTFEVIPASLVFRPPLVTPRPQAEPCSAVVTVAAGENVITTDQYGRVKVQFIWDRYGKNDNNSSEWIRMCTPMATGSGRGMIFLPRAGDEVLVSFIQGDPDQPVIVGCLYNSGNPVPYSLPGNKAISTIRTTGTAGDSNLVNEVKFNDTAGSEQLGLSAAKDLVMNANNNVTVSAAQTTFNSPTAVTGALSASSLSVNGGTVFINYQAGQVTVGSCTSNMTTVTITFPKTFIGTPKVIATPSNDPNWNNVNDTFVATVRNVSSTGCTVNIVRVDSSAGWSQSLRANWIAWE